MTKLTPTQLSILAGAAGREDGALIRPTSLRGAAAAKLAAKLIEGRLVREVRAKADLPVWREEEQGRMFSLTILKAGRTLLRASAEQRRGVECVSAEEAEMMVCTDQQASATSEPGRQRSKRALIISMLQQPDGASTGELMAATGWLPHTTRAALTGLRKAGMTVERSGDEKRGSVYRVIPATAEAA